MVDRGYLCIVFAYSFFRVDPGVSTTLSNRLHQLEKEIKRDHVSHSLQHRPEMEDLVRRGIQSTTLSNYFLILANPQLPPALRAKASELEMKMKQHLVENSLYSRPTVPELKKSFPGVYASLSAEERDGWRVIESSTMKRVYISFFESTIEQLFLCKRVGRYYLRFLEIDFCRGV